MTDINKDTIIEMLRTEVLGFSHSKIEESISKDITTVVSNGGMTRGRNERGFIVLKLTPFEDGKKKKKK